MTAGRSGRRWKIAPAPTSPQALRMLLFKLPGSAATAAACCSSRGGPYESWIGHTARLIGEWSRGSGYDVALAPDGERLLVNSDGVLRVHEVSSAAAPGRVIDHGSAVQAAAFSPDGSRALSIGKDGTARVWNAINWQPIARIVGLDSHFAVLGAFSPDNRLIAFWKNENNRPLQLSWWDVESGRLVREIADNDGDFQSFDWRADGQQLLRVSKWGDVTLFSAFSEWKVGMVLPVARAHGLAERGREPPLADRRGGLCTRWPDVPHRDFRRRRSDLGPRSLKGRRSGRGASWRALGRRDRSDDDHGTCIDRR